jgi:hypothetical protein
LVTFLGEARKVTCRRATPGDFCWPAKTLLTTYPIINNPIYIKGFLGLNPALRGKISAQQVKQQVSS